MWERAGWRGTCRHARLSVARRGRCGPPPSLVAQASWTAEQPGQEKQRHLLVHAWHVSGVRRRGKGRRLGQVEVGPPLQVEAVTGGRRNSPPPGACLGSWRPCLLLLQNGGASKQSFFTALFCYPLPLYLLRVFSLGSTRCKVSSENAVQLHQLAKEKALCCGWIN